ncbi:MAG TPA: tyrosine/phenylalanine carboxypeptidase domain-containing protein, partial [Magnetospirillaceae bacterium]|nr:tyrosine/phenylalanine carboxypeptidase domain-containing protein [Magnetospirillaceae bacterium]
LSILQEEIDELAGLLKIVDVVEAGWPKDIAAPLNELYGVAIDEAVAERQLLARGYSPGRRYDSAAFMTAQKTLYGNVEPDLFWFSMRELVKKADMGVLEQDTSSSARELIALFARAEHEAGAEHPAEIHPTVRALFEPLLKIDEITKAIKPRPDGLIDMVDMFTAALRIYKVQGWRVVHRPTAPNLAVNKAAREVIVGDGHRFLPTKTALTKTFHEIGVHVQRSHSRSSVALYNAGLPHYRTFEEGLACVMADIQQSEVHVNGQRLYAGIGLAIGVDGTPRDFRGVFELLWRIDVTKGDDPLQARKVAYKRCRRLFRGAHTATKGNCHIRDKAYVEGIFAVLGFFARTPLTVQLAADLLSYQFTPTDAAQQKLITFIKQK